MFRYLLICLMLFTGSAHAAEDDFDAVKKAAELGHADAQYNLGLMYAIGDGVLKDDAEFSHSLERFTDNYKISHFRHFNRLFIRL